MSDRNWSNWTAAISSVSATYRPASWHAKLNELSWLYWRVIYIALVNNLRSLHVRQNWKFNSISIKSCDWQLYKTLSIFQWHLVDHVHFASSFTIHRFIEEIGKFHISSDFQDSGFRFMILDYVQSTVLTFHDVRNKMVRTKVKHAKCAQCVYTERDNLEFPGQCSDMSVCWNWAGLQFSKPQIVRANFCQNCFVHFAIEAPKFFCDGLPLAPLPPLASLDIF